MKIPGFRLLCFLFSYSTLLSIDVINVFMDFTDQNAVLATALLWEVHRRTATLLGSVPVLIIFPVKLATSARPVTTSSRNAYVRPFDTFFEFMVVLFSF